MRRKSLAGCLSVLLLIPGFARADEVSVVVAGDILVVEVPSTECRSAMEEVVSLIRGADLSTANLETSLVADDVPPAASSGGLWLRADEATGEWLAHTGLDVVSLANNHRGDWGPEGALQTWRRLAAEGLDPVGFGGDAAAAWASATRGVGESTLAVVAATCGPSDDPLRARDPEAGFAPRAGVGVIGTRWVVELDVGKFAVFTAMLRQAGMQVSPGAATVRIGDQEFRRAAASRIVAELEPRDLERLRRSVGEAATTADIVLVSLHCAEGEGNGSAPPRALRRAVVDLASAGADAVVVHGPHHVRGVEWIGPGTAAVYGLGSLVMQRHRVAAQPREAYERWGVDPSDGVKALLDRTEPALGPEREIWAGLAAEMVFSSGVLTRVELVALDLAGTGPADPCRGIPSVATGGRRDEILGAVETRSAGLDGRLERSAFGLVLEPGSGHRSR